MTDRTMDLLKELRPADADRVDEVFPAAQRTALLEEIFHPPTADDAELRTAAPSHNPATRHRWQPSKRLAASGIGGLGAVGAVTAVLVFSLAGGGTSTAFAGWTADPTTPSSGQLQAAESDCQQTPFRAQVPAAIAATFMSAPTLADTRGPFSLLLYTANDESALCLAGVPTNVGHNSIVLGETPVNGIPAVAPNAILPDLTGGRFPTPPAPNGTWYWVLHGQVGTNVTAVTLTLDDGTTVQATTGNGWFLAWWPGNQGVESANVTTPTGTSTQQLGYSDPLNPQTPPTGSTNSTASGSSGSSGSTAPN